MRFSGLEFGLCPPEPHKVEVAGHHQQQPSPLQPPHNHIVKLLHDCQQTNTTSAVQIQQHICPPEPHEVEVAGHHQQTPPLANTKQPSRSSSDSRPHTRPAWCFRFQGAGFMLASPEPHKVEVAGHHQQQPSPSSLSKAGPDGCLEELKACVGSSCR
jgi:hypothetical protein